eukprot:TRINITY_DN29541_c0_g1_i1.p1 TRINITY_DN29541_c0_g1~~TRINITY_DN29541_c0_g1_i1.p1  ORF type:complete len:252 (+),score=48.03 TRINITY_DN29541_c0_g1_i1:20-775(+)
MAMAIFEGCCSCLGNEAGGSPSMVEKMSSIPVESEEVLTVSESDKGYDGKPKTPPDTPRASEPLVPLTFKTLEVKVSGQPRLQVEKVMHNHLLVRRVEDGGAVAAYNSEQKLPLEKVQRGDRIIAVDDDRGSAEELGKKLEALTESGILLVEKPQLLGLVIQRTKKDLGLEVGRSPMLGAIITDIMEDSCVAGYNNTVPLAKRVKANDVITGTFVKDDKGQIIVQRFNNYEEVIAYLEQDGELNISVFSYS